MSHEFRVLYVDDEPALLEIGKLFLEDTKEILVTTAQSADEGLCKLRDDPYDAIVCDYQMPVMDGIQFLKKLRSANNDIPFIIFTGKGREEIVIEALNNGADYYVQKGGQPKVLFVELAYKIRLAVMRKRTDAALWESRNFLNNVFSSIQDGIMVINQEMTILRVNKTMKQLSQDVLPLEGKKCYKAFFGRTERCRICPSSETLVNRKPAQQTIARTKDGNITGWFELSSYPLIDSATNEMKGVIEYYRNITGKKVADDLLRSAYEKVTCHEKELRQQYVEMARRNQQLHESETRFKNFLEIAPIFLLAPDRSGTFTYVSSGCRDIFGYHPDELIKKSLFSFIAPESVDFVRTVVDTLMEKHESFVCIEVPVNHSDGKQQIIDIRLVRATNSNTPLKGLLGIVWDIKGETGVCQPGHEGTRTSGFIVTEQNPAMILEPPKLLADRTHVAFD